MGKELRRYQDNTEARAVKPIATVNYLQSPTSLAFGASLTLPTAVKAPKLGCQKTRTRQAKAYLIYVVILSIGIVLLDVQTRKAEENNGFLPLLSTY
jgi:hypothetical protein